jgi:hypothetical protein
MPPLPAESWILTNRNCIKTGHADGVPCFDFSSITDVELDIEGIHTIFTHAPHFASMFLGGLLCDG